MSNNSKLPNGGFSLTNGSNYMLDGFSFDTDYGDGVLDKARLPESKGISSLPKGMVPPEGSLSSDLPIGVEREIDLDLTDFTKSAGQLIPLVDHSWLAEQSKEDLEGMRTHDDMLQQFAEGKFEHPQVNQIKALEDAWGKGQSTDGLSIIPNSQRKHEKYTNRYEEVSELPADAYRQRVEQAMRKLAYGDNLEDILKDLEDMMSSEKQMKQASELIISEHGLHGTVYLKEAYFPGLFNGKWDEVVNKRCASSLYIIPKNEGCAFDRVLGKEVVASIPWKKAYQTLMPRLEAFGVSKVSGSSYQSMLQQAFIDSKSLGGNTHVANTWFPTQNFEFESISSEDAQRELQASEYSDFFIEQKADLKLVRLERIASQLVGQGFLDSDQVEAVVSSGKTAQQKIDRLYDLASTPVKSSEYEGRGKDAHYLAPRRNTDVAQPVPVGEISLAKRNKLAMNKVAKLISSGLISYEDLEQVTKGMKTPEAKLASVLDFLSKPKSVQSYAGHVNKAHVITARNKMPTEKVVSTEVVEGKKIASRIEYFVTNGFISSEDANASMALDGNAKYKSLFKLAKEGVSSKKVDFSGHHFEAHISKRASAPTKTAHEVQSHKVATWLRQKMTEGSAGQELDILLSSRFSQNVLDSHKDRISSLRADHEGISGHAYVDTEAYMTSGTEGCDKGALIHRANQIPSILKNAKCGGCVFNVGGSCQKYNKCAVDASSEIVEDKASYQSETIRIANSTDAERTASLFVNNYDHSEFNLTTNNNLSFSDEAPSLEKIGEVLFGGIEL